VCAVLNGFLNNARLELHEHFRHRDGIPYLLQRRVQGDHTNRRRITLSNNPQEIDLLTSCAVENYLN
jgi:hypothetical protein